MLYSISDALTEFELYDLIGGLNSLGTSESELLQPNATFFGVPNVT